MAWKKIILSGSQAELANLVVDSNVTASAFSGDGSGLTFSGTGIASSSAQVVAYVDSEDVNLGGISGSSLDVTGASNLASLTVSGDSSFAGISGSSLDITGNAKIDGNLVLGGNITIGDQSTDNIQFGGEVSSSILPKVDQSFDLGSTSKTWNELHVQTISGSFISASAFVGDGSGLTNITVSQAATVTSTFTSQTSVAVSHNFDSKNINVVVYDSNDTQIIPASVTLTDLNTVTVTFDSATSGFVVVAKGGHIVSGSVDASNISGLDTAINDYLDLDGVISGSVQVDLTQTTNYVSGIKDRLDAEGVISGSVQVDITQTTGYTSFSSSIAADIAGISTDFADITNKPTLISSSIAGDNQGQIKVNGVNVNVTDLQTSSSPTFASLTLTGDLFVQGTTTSIETANLLVEDKFILLNSGSGAPQEGGLIIDEGNGAGHAFVFDSNSTRFGFTGSLAHNSTSTTPDAFVGAVIDIDAGHADVAEYQKNGNIKVDSGTIYIYA